jgi:hypothetical protein
MDSESDPETCESTVTGLEARTSTIQWIRTFLSAHYAVSLVGVPLQEGIVGFTRGKGKGRHTCRASSIAPTGIVTVGLVLVTRLACDKYSNIFQKVLEGIRDYYWTIDQLSGTSSLLPSVTRLCPR